MSAVGYNQLRDNLKDVLDFVRFKNGRVTITRRGRAIAELIPVPKESRPPVASRPDSSIASTAQGKRVGT